MSMSSQPPTPKPALISDFKRDYTTRGFVLLEELISPAEVKNLRAQVENDNVFRSKATVNEKDHDAVRSVYGGYESSELLTQLVTDARITERAMELLEDEVYVYQFKVNMKPPFVGDIWPWHQDFAFWAELDDMPRPDALTVAIFLDDATEFNGPMFCIPGAHRAGLYPCEPSPERGLDVAEAEKRGADVSSNLRFTLDPKVVSSLVSDWGLFSARALRGSVLFFHPNLPHASGVNISPYCRRQIFITYNSMKNALPHDPVRADYLVSTATQPIVPRHGALTVA